MSTAGAGTTVAGSAARAGICQDAPIDAPRSENRNSAAADIARMGRFVLSDRLGPIRSEEHTSELQSLTNLVCRLLLEKKKQKYEGEEQEQNQELTNSVDTQGKRRCMINPIPFYS